MIMDINDFYNLTIKDILRHGHREALARSCSNRPSVGDPDPLGRSFDDCYGWNYRASDYYMDPDAIELVTPVMRQALGARFPQLLSKDDEIRKQAHVELDAIINDNITPALRRKWEEDEALFERAMQIKIPGT